MIALDEDSQWECVKFIAQYTKATTEGLPTPSPPSAIVTYLEKSRENKSMVVPGREDQARQAQSPYPSTSEVCC